MDCLFCEIVSGDISAQKVYEDEDFLAFLDIRPVNKGHTLLIPKKHCENLIEFPTNLETDFIETAKKVGKAVVDATDAGGFNLSMNNGRPAGQEVFHAHFHIIPRFEGDGHVSWRRSEYDDDMEEYAEKIAKHL